MCGCKIDSKVGLRASLDNSSSKSVALKIRSLDVRRWPLLLLWLYTLISIQCFFRWICESCLIFSQSQIWKTFILFQMIINIVVVPLVTQYDQCACLCWAVQYRKHWHIACHYPIPAGPPMISILTWKAIADGCKFKKWNTVCRMFWHSHVLPHVDSRLRRCNKICWKS